MVCFFRVHRPYLRPATVRTAYSSSKTVSGMLVLLIPATFKLINGNLESRRLSECGTASRLIHARAPSTSDGLTTVMGIEPMSPDYPTRSSFH